MSDWFAEIKAKDWHPTKDVPLLIAEVERLRTALDGIHVGFHRTRADSAEIREGQLRADVDALTNDNAALRAEVERLRALMPRHNKYCSAGGWVCPIGCEKWTAAALSEEPTQP